MRRLLLCLALVAAFAGTAFAVEPGERLTDAALEARARAISKELRCLVCQNESIDDSNAALAHDLRVLLRERLAAGDSDEQVRDFLVRRYGQFVLLRPPIEPATYVLWFGPFAVLALGAMGIVVYLHRRAAREPAPAPLDDSERRRVARLLKEDG
ncbi:MAG TPA: cytochrome c-type biogenesis protein [Stellaceae bacterium]|nr:cytochrome c-type biogenesis protein [Stellaceae bacterium]